MNYKLIFLLLISLFLFSCKQISTNKSSKIIFKPENSYKNLGFALIYSSNLENIKKLEARSLNIYHKSLKKKSSIKDSEIKLSKYNAGSWGPSSSDLLIASHNSKWNNEEE